MARRTGTESKKGILEAAGEVFSERGYSKTTIREVARRAGISVGTIYLYFGHKEELYVELIREQMDAFITHMDTFRDQEPLDALRSLIHSYLGYAIKKTKLISMHIKEYDLELKKPFKKVSFNAQKHLIMDILKKGMGEGLFRKEINPEMTAVLMISSLKGLVLAHLSHEIMDLKKHGDSLYEVLMHGIMIKGETENNACS